MPEFDTEKPRRLVKAFGVLLATFVAIASLVLVAITHEPKSAVSSPGPAKGTIAPQIANAKSETEIIFRGKSFAIVKRNLIFYFAGEVVDIPAKEGQEVTKGDTLATYKLDREAMIHVHKVLYPEQVISLNKSLYDEQINLEKLKTVSLATKKLDLERVQKELSNLRELQSKGMAEAEAVRNKNRELEQAKKDILDIEESIKQSKAGLAKTKEDLHYYEDKQKRDLDLLEWQTNRSYPDPKLPLDVAFLKAPISGHVVWIAPELSAKAETQKGFHAMTLAPMNPMIVRCKVHELDLVKLKTGDRGTIVFDAMPDRKYPCTVSRIPWTSINPALEVPADYDIECILENTDGKIKDGLTGNVKISVAE
ncbi:MAG: HlyD family efflux transporter periplasmic adaptor subunit [Desulfomonilaceae bacterium]